MSLCFSDKSLFHLKFDYYVSRCSCCNELKRNEIVWREVKFYAMARLEITRFSWLLRLMTAPWAKGYRTKNTVRWERATNRRLGQARVEDGSKGQINKRKISLLLCSAALPNSIKRKLASTSGSGAPEHNHTHPPRRLRRCRLKPATVPFV